MENSRISILVGRNDPEAKDLGMKLRSSGAEVCYSKHSALEIQHEALIRKPEISVIPSLSAPSITARWETDLSPGTSILPCSFLQGLILISILYPPSCLCHSFAVTR